MDFDSIKVMAFFPVQANRFFFYSLQKKLNELFCSGLNRLFFGNSFKFTGKWSVNYRVPINLPFPVPYLVFMWYICCN